MAMKFRIGLVAVMCALTGGTAIVPAEPAMAQGIFEFMLRSPRQRQEERRRAYEEELRQKRQRAAQAARASVKTTTYYRYKADRPQHFSLTSLSKVETASAADPALPIDDTGTAAVAEAPLGDNPVIEAPVASTSPFNEARPLLDGFKIVALPDVISALKAHYQQYPKFVWVTDGQINDKARQALEVLSTANAYGLKSEDYDVVLPARGNTLSENDQRLRNLIEFEMALSTKVLTYVLDATRGRVNPNRISGYHDLPRHKVDLAAALSVVSETDDVSDYLVGTNPNNKEFRALVAELKRLRETDEGERIEIAQGTLIKPGRKHAELPNVVAAIRLRGSEDLKAAHAATLAAYQNGEDYTPELVALVRDFQKESGLKPDGIVGRNSIRAMVDMSVAEKTEKVVMAMERLTAAAACRWSKNTWTLWMCLSPRPTTTSAISWPRCWRRILG